MCAVSISLESSLSLECVFLPVLLSAPHSSIFGTDCRGLPLPESLPSQGRADQSLATLPNPHPKPEFSTPGCLRYLHRVVTTPYFSVIQALFYRKWRYWGYWVEQWHRHWYAYISMSNLSIYINMNVFKNSSKRVKEGWSGDHSFLFPSAFALSTHRGKLNPQWSKYWGENTRASNTLERTWKGTHEPWERRTRGGANNKRGESFKEMGWVPSFRGQI